MRISTRLKNIRRVFLDTAPVIYYVEKNPDYMDKVRFIFESLDNGSLFAVSSAVTLSECLVAPYRLERVETAQAFIQILVNSESVAFQAIEEGAASQAASLRARYNLSLPDAFQAAAALAADCDAFLTNDETLKRVAELNVIVLDEVEAG